MILEKTVLKNLLKKPSKINKKMMKLLKFEYKLIYLKLIKAKFKWLIRLFLLLIFYKEMQHVVSKIIFQLILHLIYLHRKIIQILMYSNLNKKISQKLIHFCKIKLRIKLKKIKIKYYIQLIKLIYLI